jgi:YcxB-like protein
MSEIVKLQIKQDEREYVAAVRAFFLRDYGIVKSLSGTSVMAAYIFIWLALMNVSMFVALVPALFVLVMNLSALFFAGPKRRFRRDEKLRQDFEIEFSDEGILYSASDFASRMSWSFYSRAVETDAVYLLVRGTIQMTVIPKRVFTSAAQEASFRSLLARHLPPEGLKKLKGAGERRELEEYVPPQTPPDWR